MKSVIVAYAVFVLLWVQCEGVTGSECTGSGVTVATYVDLCKKGTHEFAAAYLSASSADLADGTRCVCTMVALSPASKGSYFALNQTPRVSNCNAFVTVRGSSEVVYTCQSAVVNSHVFMNASDVTIEVSRNESVDFGFCVLMDNRNNDNTYRFNLTCETDATQNGVSTSASTEVLTSTLPSTSTSASSTPLSGLTTSSTSSTTSDPPSTSPGSTAMPTTLFSPSTSHSTTLSSTSTVLDSSPTTTAASSASTSITPTFMPFSTSSTSFSASSSPSTTPSSSASSPTSTSSSTQPSSSTSALPSMSTSETPFSSSTSSASPSDTAAFSGASGTSDSFQPTVTEDGTSTSSTDREKPEPGFSIVPVAAGVAGGLLILLVLIIVIVVVVCVRRKRKAKERALRLHPEINKSYMRFSDVILEDNILYESSFAFATSEVHKSGPLPEEGRAGGGGTSDETSIQLEDNILYESSSAWTAGEAPKTRGATQPVEGGAGGGGTSGQTSGHLGRGQYLSPAGDVYSLVQKAGEDGGPGHLQSAQLRPTPGLATPEDQEEEEEDTDAGHGWAADHSLSAEYGLAPESLQSSSPAPGSHFDEVEVALEKDGRSIPRPPGSGNPATEYAIIDHDATEELMTAL